MTETQLLMISVETKRRQITAATTPNYKSKKERKKEKKREKETERERERENLTKASNARKPNGPLPCNAALNPNP